MSYLFKINRSNKTEIKSSFVKFLIITWIVSFGCLPGPLITFVKDVTTEKQLWEGFQHQGIYRLEIDMFLRVREDIPTPNKSILVAPRQATKGICLLYYSAPQSIYDYKSNQVKWPDIVGVVKAGTRIQCTRLLKYQTLGYGDTMYIYARILSGPYVGKEVEISDLSLNTLDKKYDLYLHSPNPKVLSFEGVDGNVKDGE